MRARVNLRRLVALILLALLAPLDGLGAQLTPSLQDGELGVILKGLSLPPTLRQDLVSGLTNRIVIRVTLMGPRPQPPKLVGIAVKYDLWEETFAVKTTVDEVAVAAASYRNVDEVISMLTNLSLPQLFTVDPGSGGNELALTTEILFDPIEKARMEEIRKWVAENNRPSTPDSATLSPGLSAPRSTTARVFNRIFEQYAAGASVAAAWKQTVTSKPFRAADLHP